MSATRRAVQGAFIALVGLFAISTANAQQLMLSKESYLPAPKEIADVLATRGDLVTLTNLSPDGKKFLVAKNDGMPSIQRLGCPHVILGEVAFDHLANRAHELWVRSNSGFDLFFVADKRTVPVQAPTSARVSNPVWSPDGSQLAFFAHFDNATHIYVADESGAARKLTTIPVLATLDTSFQWSKDGKKIQTVLFP